MIQKDFGFLDEDNEFLGHIEMLVSKDKGNGEYVDVGETRSSGTVGPLVTEYVRTRVMANRRTGSVSVSLGGNQVIVYLVA